MASFKHLVDRFFKDKNGHWTLIQWPNALLWAWIILVVANFFLHNKAVGLLQGAVLFSWAYLELTQGISYFRKTLGAAILIIVIVGYFI